MELMDFIVDFLPLFMFLMMGAMLFSGYPVAFILGGVSITFGLLGFAFDVFTYIKAKRNNSRIIRFNVNFGERNKGKSSWNTGLLSKLKMCSYYIKEIWKI